MFINETPLLPLSVFIIFIGFKFAQFDFGDRDARGYIEIKKVAKAVNGSYFSYRLLVMKKYWEYSESTC